MYNNNYLYATKKDKFMTPIEKCILSISMYQIII